MNYQSLLKLITVVIYCIVNRYLKIILILTLEAAVGPKINSGNRKRNEIRTSSYYECSLSSFKLTGTYSKRYALTALYNSSKQKEQMVVVYTRKCNSFFLLKRFPFHIVYDVSEDETIYQRKSFGKLSAKPGSYH